MKIPEGKYLSDMVIQAWESAAIQIGLDSGIFIEVVREFDPSTSSTYMPTTNMPYTYAPHSGNNTAGCGIGNIVYTSAVSICPRVSRIYFKINEHEFDNLTELKRAIKLKAFL